MRWEDCGESRDGRYWISGLLRSVGSARCVGWVKGAGFLSLIAPSLLWALWQSGSAGTGTERKASQPQCSSFHLEFGYLGNGDAVEENGDGI